MKGQLYSLYVLTVLAAVFCITNAAEYLTSIIDNFENVLNNIIPLILSLCFGVAAFTMIKKRSAGWFAFLLGILILMVKALMTMTVGTIFDVVPQLCIYLFMIFYILDDNVMSMFGFR